MSDLLTISLNNVRFRAFHGIHPEERQKGNDFVVNMVVEYVPQSSTIISLACAPAGKEKCGCQPGKASTREQGSIGTSESLWNALRKHVNGFL